MSKVMPPIVTHCLCIAWMLLLLAPSTGWAETFYVSKMGDNSDGTSWNRAKRTIQGGVDVALTAGDEVVISNDTYVLTTAITVPQAITVRSWMNDPATVLIDGSGTVHCISLTANATLAGLTITNGNHGSTPGGGIVMSAAGTISNCVIANNVSRRGGGIYMTDTGLIVGCTFVTNRASMYDGGAIWMATGMVRDCIFALNYAADSGGAIYAVDGLISNCLFTANSSGSDGGASEVVNTRVLHCAFSDNSSAGGGAGLSLTGTGIVWRCGFTNNVAKSHGGAMVMTGDGFVDHCSFVANRATTSNKKGGGLSMSAGWVRDCDFRLNTSVYPGSAIAMSGGVVDDCCVASNGAGVLNANGAIEMSGSAMVTNCVITENYSYLGGGVSMSGGTLVDCLIASNTSVRSGGGIHQMGGLVDRCRVLFNSIAGNFPGGGVYMNSSNAFQRNSLIAANASPNAGGGIYLNAGVVENCTIVGNAATALGDGIYVKATLAWVTNTIAYYNAGGDNVHEEAPSTFLYGCAGDVSHNANGNNTNAPAFLDPGSGTPGTNYVLGVYLLGATSPCRNAGTNADWMGMALDLSKRKRLSGTRVDMGAEEFVEANSRGTILAVY